MRRCLFLICGLICAIDSRAQFIRYEPGHLPILLSAPHGGYLEPDSLKDRTCSGCVTTRDEFTQELTDEISRALFEATGKRPYVVVNLLARIKMDANRDMATGADGDPHAITAWQAFHGSMADAHADITARFGRGLVFDVHAHGHAIQRLELGYLPDEAEYRVPDAELDASRGNRNTFNALVADNVNGLTFSQLVRGPSSLGQMYEDRGYPAVPSRNQPFPLEGEPYFAGGYISQQYGSRHGGSIDGVQVEANRHGVRHTADQRRAFADSTALILIDFFRTHYGIDLLSMTSGVPPQVPSDPILLTAYPNPFNPSTVIRWTLDAGLRTRLSVHDVLGREVAVLVNRWMPAGSHAIRFEARHLPSGIYIVSLDTERGRHNRKIHLVK